MKFILSLLILIFSSLLQAQSVSYKLSMPKPQNHYFHVEMELEDFNEKEIDISLPVWAPGSYLVREFSKNINMVKAFDENGNPLEIKKQRKNSWTINKSKNKKVVVKYEVYAFELSVRTSFLDLTHGYVSGSGVFMFVEGHLDVSGELKIIPFEGFSTVLQQNCNMPESPRCTFRMSGRRNHCICSVRQPSDAETTIFVNRECGAPL